MLRRSQNDRGIVFGPRLMMRAHVGIHHTASVGRISHQSLDRRAWGLGPILRPRPTRRSPGPVGGFQYPALSLFTSDLSHYSRDFANAGCTQFEIHTP